MDWIEVATKFGFPVLCVFALGYVMFKAALWAAHSIATPLVTAGINLMNKLGADMKDQTKIMGQQQLLMETMQDQLGTMNDTLEAHGEILDTLSKGCPLLEKKRAELPVTKESP